MLPPRCSDSFPARASIAGQLHTRCTAAGLIRRLLPAAAAALSLGLSAGPAAAGADKQVQVTFGGKTRSFDKALEVVPESARETLLYWRAWADDNDFQMALDAQGRILVLSSSGNKLKGFLATAEKAAKRFDEIAPLPPDRVIGTLQVPTASSPTDHRGDATAQQTSQPQELPANIGLQPYEAGPIVLFHLVEQQQQITVLQRLAFDHENIKEWLPEANTRAGFAVESPLVAAWLETPVNEEWSPEAELVNRTAQLLTLRRFGHLPYWLRSGVAWKIEWDLIGGIFCFPYRSGFVFSNEHGAWPADLAKMYSTRKDYPIQPSELGDWPAETYREEFAKRSFGFVSFLVDNFDGGLSRLLDAVRQDHERGSIAFNANGVWERIARYEVPATQVFTRLAEVTRPDAAVELTTYLRKGLRYKVK